MKESLKKTKGVPPILVFNPLKRLVGIFASMSGAAKALNTSTTNIKFACDGTCISGCNLYFRQLDPRIEITLDDLANLKLQEYDEMCGVTRRYYLTKNMGPGGKKTEINKNKK